MLIGEVSKRYGITVDTLRYYEKIGLLTVKRINNNRFYTEENIKKLESILAMKEMMFSLEEIKRVLEIDQRIDEGLKEDSINCEDLERLLKEIETKYCQLEEREKKLQIVKGKLTNIIRKIESFKGGNASE